MGGLEKGDIPFSAVDVKIPPTYIPTIYRRDA